MTTPIQLINNGTTASSWADCAEGDHYIDWESHPLLSGFDEEAVARAAEAPTSELPGVLLTASHEETEARAAEAQVPGTSSGFFDGDVFCAWALSDEEPRQRDPESARQREQEAARQLLLHTDTEWTETASVASSRTTVRHATRTVVCIICGEVGHDANTGCTKGLCFRCKRPGHVARKCPQARLAEERRRLERRCYACGQPGHFARDRQCPAHLTSKTQINRLQILT